MKTYKLAVLSLALAAAFPAVHAADASDALLKELQAMKARMAELEQRVQAQQAQIEEAKASRGMTPEQQQEFNRIVVKTEALEDSRDAMGFKGLKISGYMDPTYISNNALQRSGFQFMNSAASTTDPATGNTVPGYSYDNSYMGSLVLDLVKETDSGARWHLTLSPQRGSQAVMEGSNSLIQEASVSVPLGDLQTRVMAGHLPDWSGYEMQQPTLNKLITHNLLYDFTLPTAYTGAGMELLRGDWDLKAMLANINTSRRNAGEMTPSLAFRADYAKSEFMGLGFAGVIGKAGSAFASHETRVNMIEADVTMTRGDLVWAAQVGFGNQDEAATATDPDTGAHLKARWSGLSVMAAYKFRPQLEGSVRFDRLFNSANGGGVLGGIADNYNGIGPALDSTGTAIDPSRGVNRSALSFGLNYYYSQNVTFKAEYRLDTASGPVFLDRRSGGYRSTNQLLGAAMVVSF